MKKLKLREFIWLGHDQTLSGDMAGPQTLSFCTLSRVLFLIICWFSTEDMRLACNKLIAQMGKVKEHEEVEMNTNCSKILESMQQLSLVCMSVKIY